MANNFNTPLICVLNFIVMLSIYQYNIIIMNHINHIYNIYKNMIYKLSDINNFINHRDALMYVKQYIYNNIQFLYEGDILSYSNNSKIFIHKLLEKIRINRHYPYILDILKYCISGLNMRIKYENLDIHKTTQGNVIILRDKLYDCSLKKYIQILHSNLCDNINRSN